LISGESFEGFYSRVLGLDVREFVEEYRNDFSWDYARALRDYGIDVVQYVPSHHEDGLRVASDGLRVRFLPLLPAARLCPPIFEHAISPIERYVAEIVNAASMLSELRESLRRDAIDVLYVQEYWTGRFDLLTRRLAVPIVAGEQGGSEGRYVRLWKRSSFRRAAALICLSRAELRRVTRCGATGILIPNSVDDEFFTPSPRLNRERVVLTVGRLEDAQKRVSDAIRALRLLPGDWSLEIVGSGPDEGALPALAEREGVAHRTRFVGFVSDKEVLRSKYRSCGVLVHPSAWEGMPVAVLEAMSCGAPVVTTPLRGLADLIEDGHNGLIAPRHDPSQLAESILRAFRERSRLGQAARATIERGYARRRTVANLGQVLRNAASLRGVQ
jgi:glycosyltransferase involved in cell wall biosynthesis